MSPSRDGRRHGGPSEVNLREGLDIAHAEREAARADRVEASHDRDVAGLLLHRAALLYEAAARDREVAALLRHQAALDRAECHVVRALTTSVRSYDVVMQPGGDDPVPSPADDRPLAPASLADRTIAELLKGLERA